MKSLNIGNKAPKFSYKNSDGNKDSLDNYLGSKVLLCFYPKDNTPGCTSEACSLSESIVKFDEQKVKVFGISKDNEVSHQKFVSKYNLKITLIPDPELKIITKYGVLNDKPRKYLETGGDDEKSLDEAAQILYNIDYKNRQKQSLAPDA
mgnify:CR=1 FL=1